MKEIVLLKFIIVDCFPFLFLFSTFFLFSFLFLILILILILFHFYFYFYFYSILVLFPSFGDCFFDLTYPLFWAVMIDSSVYENYVIVIKVLNI